MEDGNPLLEATNFPTFSCMDSTPLPKVQVILAIEVLYVLFPQLHEGLPPDTKDSNI